MGFIRPCLTGQGHPRPSLLGSIHLSCLKLLANILISVPYLRYIWPVQPSVYHQVHTEIYWQHNSCVKRICSAWMNFYKHSILLIHNMNKKMVCSFIYFEWYITSLILFLLHVSNLSIFKGEGILMRNKKCFLNIYALILKIIVKHTVNIIF